MLTEPWHLYSGIILQSIAALTQLTVLIYYIASFKSNTNESKKMELLNVITLLVLFLSTTCWLVNYCGLFNYLNINCNYAFFSVYLLYLYYHGLMYCIYVARLHIVYDDTKFELRKSTKIVLWLIIIIYFIMYTLIVSFENFYMKVGFPVQFESVWSICWGEPSSVLIVTSFIIIESIFPTITMILFIKPLWILYNKTNAKETKQNKDSRQIKKDRSLLKLSTKYTLLTMITIISSTAASIGHIFLEIVFIASVSVWINALCIILYENRFSMYYKGIIRFMCYPCYKYIKGKKEPEMGLAQLSRVPSRSPTAGSKTSHTQTHHDPSVLSSIDSADECPV